MTGDEIIESALAHVRKAATGDDEAWLRGYALGQIHVAEFHLGADSTKADAAEVEIERLTRSTRSEA